MEWIKHLRQLAVEAAKHSQEGWEYRNRAMYGIEDEWLGCDVSGIERAERGMFANHSVGKYIATLHPNKVLVLLDLLDKRKNGGWISVKDSLPNEDYVVWGFGRTMSGYEFIGEAFIAGRDGEWHENTMRCNRVMITHWQKKTPPSPPEGDG